MTKRINEFIEELASECSKKTVTSETDKGKTRLCKSRFALMVPILRQELEQGNYVFICGIAREKGVAIPEVLQKRETR